MKAVSYSARVRFRAVAALGLLVLAGCGGSDSGGLTGPKIGKAKSFALADFQPTGPVKPGQPTNVSFHITTPDGKRMTKFKTGGGPHTGVHLIFVKDDLSQIIHLHPPIKPDGSVSEKVTFPSAGPWHTLVDVYPDLGSNTLRNFQLTDNVKVKGAYTAQALPALQTRQKIGGDTFSLSLPKKLKSLRPQFFDVKVTDANGRPAKFGSWFGATAHAVFFKDKTLDYFHTHVCRPENKICQNATAGSTIVGKADKPGVLTVGTLLPTAGKWKLFLQTKIDGKVVTVPYTLNVA